MKGTDVQAAADEVNAIVMGWRFVLLESEAARERRSGSKSRVKVRGAKRFVWKMRAVKASLCQVSMRG